MLVSIGIIALNEEDYLPALWQEILKQDYNLEEIELVLVDSGSTDRTLELMEEFSHQKVFHNVQVLGNPKRTQSSGWNVVIDHYSGDVLLRLDAHASIPEDFIRKNVENIQDGAAVSGGKRPAIMSEITPYSQMLLAAENSLFGSGIAPYRTSSRRRPVKSLFHPMFRREVIDQVGHYDEKLIRTEDNEYNYRVSQAGYDLIYDDSVISYQYARPDLQRMMQQKFGNGEWIAKTLFVCKPCISIFHLVPFAFVMAMLLSFILLHWTSWPVFLVMGSYVVANLLMSFLALRHMKFHPVNLLLPIVFFLLHVSYGVGSLVGFIQTPKFLKDYRQSSKKN